MKKITALVIVLAGLALSLPASAQELPDFVVKAVAEITIYENRSYADDKRIKQGSGVFVDHGGCLFTNSHVVLNLVTDEVEPVISVAITDDRAKPPKRTFEGEVIYVDQELDLAYVCPIEETDVFTHFFVRKKQPQFTQLPFGADVWVMGFPTDGQGTITISPGHVVGFIEAPDISMWLGVPDLNQDLLKLYKTDTLAGPGVSGGLLVDKDLELVGVPFAGSLTPGAFVYNLSDDMYLKFERDVRSHLHRENLVPPDCVFDPESDYYYRASVRYYDNQCELEYDELMENEVRRTYKAFCGKEITGQRLVPAIRRSKQLGDLRAWSDNLILICPNGQPVAEEATTAGDFAYGKDRLSDLEQEQQLAKNLKEQIDAEFPALYIDEKDWSTVVNSYVYGQYPLKAISRAIELGGYTVHPTIPYDLWKNSDDFKLNM